MNRKRSASKRSRTAGRERAFASPCRLSPAILAASVWDRPSRASRESAWHSLALMRVRRGGERYDVRHGHSLQPIQANKNALHRPHFALATYFQKRPLAEKTIFVNLEKICGNTARARDEYTALSPNFPPTPPPASTPPPSGLVGRGQGSMSHLGFYNPEPALLRLAS